MSWKGKINRLIEPRPLLAAERQRFSNEQMKKMIVPLVIEQLLQMVVGLADTMMVSYAGEAVVAGVGLDNMIYTVFIYLFTAIASGGSVVVSQYIGNEDRRKANLSSAQIFHIAGILSLICMTVVLVSGSRMLKAMYPTTAPETLEACRTYLWIVSLSFPANAMYNAGAALYRTMGKTNITMRISIMANLINVVGNAVGIFVFHAGAAGVAWPTVLSWTVAGVVMTGCCFNRKQEVFVTAVDMVRPNAEMVRRILGVAIPNSIENVLFQVSKVVLGMLIATFGTSQIAANTTAQTIWSLAATMNVAASTVCITVIGQCTGAGDTEAAAWYMRKMVRLSIVLSFLWNAAVMLLTPVLLPLYDLSSETKRLILIVVAIHNLFAAFVQPFSGPLSFCLRAAGDIRFTMWASIFATVVCRTLLSFLLARTLGLGVIGIALAMVLDWSIKAVLDVVRFYSGRWKGRRVIE